MWLLVRPELTLAPVMRPLLSAALPGCLAQSVALALPDADLALRVRRAVAANAAATSDAERPPRVALLTAGARTVPLGAVLRALCRRAAALDVVVATGDASGTPVADAAAAAPCAVTVYDDDARGRAALARSAAFVVASAGDDDVALVAEAMAAGATPVVWQAGA